jgi:membrane protein YqaA with SNARE-associated domain
MGKLYRFFSIFMFVVMAYLLGGLTGYVLGYNDKYQEVVVAYKHNVHRQR